jgi:hypothetical protein
MQFSNIHLHDLETGEKIALKRLGPNRIALHYSPGDITVNLDVGTELGFHSFRSLEFELLTGGPDREPIHRAVNIELFVMIEGILNALQNVHHIGPLRDMPERAYRTDQLSTTNESTRSVLSMLTNDKGAVRSVGSALKAMHMARDLEVTTIAPGYAGIVVHNYGTSRKDSLADVGFGISQVLPILARLATAAGNSLVLIEQPELHLHPETQGSFLDAMVSLATQRGISLFVESHSENMLLRLRRRIASGQLDSDDVQVFIVDDGEVKRVDIDRKGSIDFSAFPPDFFEEDWLDTIEIAKAAASREK